METNEINRVIAEWLGVKIVHRSYDGDHYYKEKKYLIRVAELDFLHDRNQQKWIEDELERKDCEITYSYSPILKTWRVVIYSEKYGYIAKTNKSKDQAFIECVLELVEKERMK